MQCAFSRRIMGSLAVLSLSLLVACGDESTGPGNPANTGSVSGTVTFSGTWPASGDVQVGVYSSLDPGGNPTGPPAGSTDPIEETQDPYAYTISGLDAGAYAGVIVSWRDPGNPAGAVVLGRYEGGAAIVVTKGEDAPGFDMNADFSLMP